MKSSWVITGCWVAALTCVTSSCSRQARVSQAPSPVTNAAPEAHAPANRQVFEVTGVIQELKPQEKTVVIKHEKIPGYMEAMTMPFRIRETNELGGLQPGDPVAFRMIVTPDEGWIERLTRIERAPSTELPSIQSFRRVRDVEPLKVGDRMPDYRFTNELGRVISLGDFKGSALALTFIFTRCPFPDFCPRMSSHFQEAYQKLLGRSDAPTNWHMLSISFDPAFDTPQVLKAYGKRYQHDPQRWDFATGSLIDIDAITEQFGLAFARQGVNWDHNLRTVVIDADGKIQRILIGNTWTPEELLAEIVTAAKVTPGRVSLREIP
jgi:protein SCO1/2